MNFHYQPEISLDTGKDSDNKKKKQRRKTINIIPRSLITEPQLKPRNHSKDKKLWPLKGSLNSSTILVSYSLDALKSIFLKGG